MTRFGVEFFSGVSGARGFALSLGALMLGLFGVWCLALGVWVFVVWAFGFLVFGRFGFGVWEFGLRNIEV